MLKRYFILGLFILFFSSEVFSGEERLPLTLAQDGKSDFQIVLPERASKVQSFAAAELEKYFFEITGAHLPIRQGLGAVVGPAKKLFLIGPSPETQKRLGASVREDQLPYDTMIVKRIDDVIVFSGHSIRGPLYAVYSFLEDALGCRWWTPDESFIPKKQSLIIKDLDVQFSPKLIYRESRFRNSTNGPFSVKLKCNGNFNRIPEEMGGHHRFEYFVHSFYSLIPPEVYFDKHPDWFSEQNGVRGVGVPWWCWGGAPKERKDYLSKLKAPQRLRDGGQLCMSNPGLVAEIVKNILIAVKKNPETTIVSVSQNDWYGPCTCPKCKAIEKREESESGPLVRFVNQVAEEVAKVHPDLFIETLAYQYTRKPPRYVRARDNVIIRLCPIENDFARPLRTSPYNQSFRRDIEGWKLRSDRLFIWDYLGNFEMLPLPFPNYLILKDNIQYFIENHVIGIFAAGDYYLPTGDFLDLRHWLVGKLLWDPESDPEALMTEFISGYYAPEFVPLYLRYFNLLAHDAAESNVPVKITNRAVGDWLTLSTLNELCKIMDQAEALARSLESKDPIKYKRITEKVLRERTSLDLILVKEWFYYKTWSELTGVEFLGPKDPVSFSDIYVERCKRFGIQQYYSGQLRSNLKNNTMDHFFEKLRKPLLFANTKIAKPECCRALPDNCWYSAQENVFNNYKPDNQFFIVEDSAASNGQTICLPTEQLYKSILWQSSAIPELLKPSKNKTVEPKYRVLLAMRCDLSKGGGVPNSFINAGLCKDSPRDSFGIKKIPLSKIRGKNYVEYELWNGPLSKVDQIWIQPTKESQKTENIYIDRVIVIREH